MWRYASLWDILNIFKANIFGSVHVFIFILGFIGFSNFSKSLIIIDFVMCTVLVCISRLSIRLFFAYYFDIFNPNKKNIKKNILCIGAGYTGQNILRQTLQGKSKSINVVGFLDDDPKKIGRRLNGVPIITNVKNISSLSIRFDEIYICVPSANRLEMRKIIEHCKKTNKPFKTLPSISELMEGKVSISQFREVSILDLLGREEVKLDIDSINTLLKGKRVLVTGAGGSIGSELVRQCIKYDPSVLVMLDSSELNLFELDREVVSDKSKILYKPILSDIRDYDVINQVFSEYRPQIVFHAAAYKHVPMQEKFPWEAIKTNIFGTNNLSKLASKYGVEKFVLVSTDKAVRPANVMGATKRIAEMIVQNQNISNSKTEFMAVRFGNVLGSSGSVIPIFQEQIKNGGPVTITDPEMQRFFMSIPEASQLILQAGSLGTGGEVFILDMGKPIKIIDIANELIRLSGFIPNDDINIEITGSRPGEKKIEELSLPSEYLDKTKHNKIFVLNNSLSRQKLTELMSGVESLKNKIINKSPSQIKTYLSDILPEFKPVLDYKINSKKDDTKIEA
tara:strand:- start:2197 stop:3891 length:1695 start_codon:yes stop_codon:yes gene_type:complete